MSHTLGFDTKQRNSFFDQIWWFFLQLKQDSYNIIHSVVGAHNQQAFYMFK
jgi:hypothetical protein